MKAGQQDDDTRGVTAQHPAVAEAPHLQANSTASLHHNNTTTLMSYTEDMSALIPLAAFVEHWISD